MHLHSRLLLTKFAATAGFSNAQMKLRVLGLLLLFLHPLAGAADLRVGLSTDRPPYSYQLAGVNHGIEVDLLQAILAEMKQPATLVVLPNARLISALQQGEIDVAASVQGQDGAGVYYSAPYVEYHNYAISLKSAHDKLDSLADLNQFNFVIWQGGWSALGPQFAAIYQPDANGHFRSNYTQTSSQRNQNMMFWAKRVAVIICDKEIFEWYRKDLAHTFETGEEVEYHDLFDSQTVFSVAFRSAALRDQFNLALARIRSNGTYKNIRDKNESALQLSP